MSIVIELHPTSSPAECTKASQFQTMQASFLAKIETQKVSISPNTIHNPQQVYATFQTFNASSNQSTQFTQPIFHAVSPLEHKEGYIIRYLSQHCLQACNAIALITKQLPIDTLSDPQGKTQEKTEESDPIHKIYPGSCLHHPI